MRHCDSIIGGARLACSSAFIGTRVFIVGGPGAPIGKEALFVAARASGAGEALPRAANKGLI
jgi:hypothetical protein